MSNAPLLYARYSDIFTYLATSWVWQAGTPDANYPVGNMKDNRADTVAKVTGTSGTLRGTFSGSQTAQGVVIVNSNATAISIQNGAGLNVAMSIPTTPPDGLRLDPWIDLRGVANTSSTQWDIVLTGPTGTAVGEVLLISTWRELPILIALDWEEMHGLGLLATDYGTRNKWRKGRRQRKVTGRVIDGSYDSDVDYLVRDAYGAVRNLPIILNEAVNDAMFVDLTEESLKRQEVEGRVIARMLTFIEQQKGIL